MKTWTNNRYLVGKINDTCLTLCEKLTGVDAGYFLYTSEAKWIFRPFAKFYREETVYLIAENLKSLNNPEPESEYALAVPKKKDKKKP